MKFRSVGALVLAAALMLGGCAGRQSPSPASLPAASSAAPSADAAASSVPAANPAVEITMDFGGDVNLAEGWPTTEHLDACGGDIAQCVDPELIARMNAADLCCINNEFCYSTRGKPLKDKAYTFRAQPERVKVLETLGVDLVTLANNHVYDYGKNAFADTLSTLSGAGIAAIGAGKDEADAAAPYYYHKDGVTVALVDASRAEKNRMTPGAGEDTPGVLLCYDTARFCAAIAEAKAHADFVVALVHWGTEYSTELEQAQRTGAEELVAAGADAVMGTHAHCLQGIGYEDGKPVFYNLGNFWFNEKTLDSCIAELKLTGTGPEDLSLACTVVPAVQEGCETRLATDSDGVLERLNALCEGAAIARDGTVSPAA